jgi:hypothetical protein
VALAISIGACGPSKHGSGVDANKGGDAGVDATVLPHILQAISVSPGNPIVQLDLGATAQQGFIATGLYMDGQTEDMTSKVTWSSSNAAAGTMSGPTLTIPAFSAANAVVSLIKADYNSLEGVAQITIVAYRKSGPTQDFFFILPYNDPGGPQSKPLDFSTAIPALDVFFLMDTTGSMSGEIANLQGALNSTVVPQIQGAVANTQFGVGAQEDFPVDPYGSPSCSFGDGTPDQAFKLRTAITSNISSVQAGVNGLRTAGGSTIGCGSDTPEGALEGIYQAATGEGISGPSPINIPANHSGIGGVGFRAGTMPIIVGISDAATHGVGETGTCTSPNDGYAGTVATVAHSRAQTKTALSNICARYVGIAAFDGTAGVCQSVSYMTDIATATGARVSPSAWDVGTRPAGCASNQCCTGQNGVGQATDASGLCPLVFDVSTSGTGVGANIATGISLLARFATFDVPTQKQGVTTDINGVPLPAPHTTADFIKMVTPVSFVKPPPPPTIPDPTFDSTTFHNVTPGTKVSFTVNAFNDFVMATGDAQIYRATIQVTASGCNVLDQRDVLILVPPIPVVN